jgi:hypothetical protein
MTLSLESEIETLQRLVEVLQRQLDDARTREQAALEREQAASKREAMLLALLRQRHPQGISLPEEGQNHAPDVFRESMRPHIVALLQKYPQGLTRTQIEHALATRKHLKHTLLGMCRAGILVRKGIGVYALPSQDTASRA